MAEMDAFERRLAEALLRYADDVRVPVDAALVAHVAVVRHPRRRWVAVGWSIGSAPGLAWMLLVAALVIALVAGLLLIASGHRDRSALVPTGIEVLSGDTAKYDRTVVDGNGIIWATEAGRLLRFDPASGSGRSWTVADDPTFAAAAVAASSIAPARDGGVWLVTSRTLRSFDGTAFRQILDAPVDVVLASEGPDGSLWASGPAGALLRWDGSAWSRHDAVAPARDVTVTALAVDSRGTPWIGWSGGSDEGGVSRLDGAGWTTFGRRDSEPLATGVSSIRPLSDGSVWVTAGSGFARYDGSRWTPTGDAYGRFAASSVARGPDGSIWFARGDEAQATVAVTRALGGVRIDYGPAAGVPSANEIVTTKDEVFASGRDGIFRLEGARWARAWPATAPVVIDPTTVVAVSRDELWASSDEALWHFIGGRWSLDPIDPGRSLGGAVALTLAPDGRIWAAGADGVAYRGEGSWILVDRTPANAVAVDRDGTAWVVGRSTDCKVWSLRAAGGGWTRSQVPTPPLSCWSRPSVGADDTGRLWLGLPGGWLPGGLARLDGASWETLSDLGGMTVDGASIAGTTADGDVWIDASIRAADGTWGTPQVLRFDGVAWTTAGLADTVQVTIAPDGSVWSSDAATNRISRFDGGSWAVVYRMPAAPGADPVAAGPIAIAPDGSLFMTGSGGVWRLPMTAGARGSGI